MAVGLTLAMGYAFGVLTLGGCAGAPWPTNGKLPERVVDRLTECGKKGPTPLKSENYDLAFTVHVTEDDTEARVDDVMLTSSTLHLHEVEACMTDALYGMRTPLEALALRRRRLVPDPIAPETRPMFGQAEIALLLEAGAVVVVGLAAYYVVVHVILDKPRPKPRRHPVQPETAEPPAPALPTVATTPSATSLPTAVPITTAVPVARRNPNQTCDDKELDRLEAEKKKLCGGYAVSSCNPKKVDTGKIRCSAILRAIPQRQACLAARQLIQDRCFGGKPDAGHKTQMDDVENGIRQCEALKLINCAKGHSMAGL